MPEDTNAPATPGNLIQETQSEVAHALRLVSVLVEHESASLDDVIAILQNDVVPLLAGTQEKLGQAIKR